MDSVTKKAVATPDIVFAQKATAIVKASGMDPRAIDLDTFRKIAPLIFSNAYCAIYKETLISVLNENSSKTDQILNSQLVIDGLLAKTRNPALTQITGNDIYEGHHRAISIIVGILFAEGQRLWMEKVKLQKIANELQKTPSHSKLHLNTEQDLNAEEHLMSHPNFSHDDLLNEARNNNKHTGQGRGEEDDDDLTDDANDLLPGHTLHSEEKRQEFLRKQLKRLKSDHREQMNAQHLNNSGGGNVSPRELNHLLNRISYLEEKLKKTNKTKGGGKQRPKSANNTSSSSRPNSATRHKISRSNTTNNKSPHGSPIRRTHSRELEYSDNDTSGHESLHDHAGISDNDSQNDGNGSENSATNRPKKSTKKTKKTKKSRISQLIEASQRAIHLQNNPSSRENSPKKTRPSSAPLTRKVKHVSSRLYNVPRMNADLHMNVHPISDLPTASKPTDKDSKLRPTTPPRPKLVKASNAWHSNNNVTNPSDTDKASLYTYDMRSGRRILQSQADYEEAERKRMQAVMGNITKHGGGGETDDDIMMRGAGGNMNTGRRSEANSHKSGEPVKPDWPGKSTSKSVSEWLMKMKKARNDYVEETPEVPQPRHFNAYKKLERNDLIISIEHCVNCEHHNISTRHKCEEYVRNADAFLKICSQIIFESCLCIRVGVTRFSANVTPTSKTSDNDSRIGAFEIQIAYKSNNGDVMPEVLHSKLMSRRWPSKTVLEKRLRSYLTKMNISQFNQATLTDEESAGAEFNNSDCAEPYPVGYCSSFLETPLAAPHWNFSVKPMTAAEQSGEDGSTPKLPNIQWVYDSRSLARNSTGGSANLMSKFKVGATVRVSNLVYTKDQPTAVERQMLVAIIKDNNASNISTDKKMTVKLKYHMSESVVTTGQCMLLNEYTERSTNYTSSTIPTELEALLLLAKRNNVPFTWLVPNNPLSPTASEDRKEGNDILLTRATLFHQLRALSWAVENKLKSQNITAFHHPNTKLRVEIQFAYSEEVLDWCFNDSKFVATSNKMLFNITALEQSVVPVESKAVSPTKTQPKSPSAASNAPKTPVKSGSKEWKPSAETASLLAAATEAEAAENNEAQADHEDIPLSPQPDDTNNDNKDAGDDDEEHADILLPGEEPSAPSAPPSKPASAQAPVASQAVAPAVAQVSPRPPLSSPRAETSTATAPTTTTPAGVAVANPEPHLVINTSNSTTELTSAPVTGANISSKVSPRPAETSQKASPRVEPSSPAVGATGQVALDTGRDSLYSLNSQHSSKLNVNAGTGNANDPLLSDAERAEVEAQLELTERQNLDYQTKDLVFSSIIIEGDALVHVNYDSVMVQLTIDDKHYNASVCLARERGSKRRSFNLTWGDIYVKMAQFESENAYLSVVISDTAVADAYQQSVYTHNNGDTNTGNVRQLPTLSNTQLGVTKNSVRIPLYKFMQPSFEIKTRVIVEQSISDSHSKSMGPNITNLTTPTNHSTTPGQINVVIHGHAHEAKEARNTRIMSMKPQDLMKLKFEPFPIDHDDDLSEEHSDSEDEEDAYAMNSPIVDKGKKGKAKSPQDAELNQTLFPKPSLHNLMSPSNTTTDLHKA